ncbi:multifunctional acyl-CoA thioesterase I/protease I/lysophospholipase L1 [Edwardsiella ictaluri]|uniref:Multifunctional acyl-CoA thioesterase I/protease I/lysophospholipase L1 n=1 Tax=Edwardsiella ictaluri TaxID=67780 RepID=A0ABY8GHK6_EDWIC|nr:multifunctional acyl-CoA thioesterase I/protease I/lysophospholipase L1 [Edwardsiella ictaluri]ELV7528413.1 multifunctional acyl-CoA thioesterase I/protease I/lysophospholipase L1 [Edwardsiella ictaluri]WFN97004.1 multifunctional acyl-CoA thioesterase I/protease I/lysophospholipase L1 [Edwardsiella ictaluri]
MMNFNYVLRWHRILLIVVMILCGLTAARADTLLVLGDSLSAAYRLPEQQGWVARLAQQWQRRTPPLTVINASISGDTAGQGLLRLPALLQQHRPRWVLIELGANDGLRGVAPDAIAATLSAVIGQVQQAGATPLLMQIRLPPNYGRRYGDAFAAIYPQLAARFNAALLPFYMEAVVGHPDWIQNDGLHPNALAQPFIADWMAQRLLPQLTRAEDGAPSIN